MNNRFIGQINKLLWFVILNTLLCYGILLSGDRYDDDPTPRRSTSSVSRGGTSGGGGASSGAGGSNLDEIDDWDKGKNNNMVGETIGKVKEFVNRMKGFDDTSDYGWVAVASCM